MAKPCDHFLQLKPQKAANFIKKSQLKCSASKKHFPQQYSLCLHCGEVRCDSQTSEEKCSHLHFYANKHPLILRLLAKEIYCQLCDQNVLDCMGEVKPNDKKLPKILDLHQKIMNFLEKHPLKEFKDLPTLLEKKSSNTQSKEKIVKKSAKKLQANLRVFGLSNLGNTCFFNSVLQCLYSTQELHEKYRNIDFNNELKLQDFEKTVSSKSCPEINLLFKKFLNNKDKIYCPKSLFSAICKAKATYKSLEQQDAQELFGTLINFLIDGEKKQLKITKAVEKKMYEEKKERQKITTLEKMFGFYLASRLYCLSCEEVSWNLDFSLDLNIEVLKTNAQKVEMPEGIEIPQQEIGQNGLIYPIYKEGHLSFVDQFFAPQLLSKNNFYRCEKCAASKAVRKFYMCDPPEILSVVLKRFNNNGTKNNTQVKICQNISVKNHVIRKKENEQDLQYEIYAMVVHSGTARGGHYLAYTKRDEEWFYFSDSHFKAASWEKARSSNPYILYYRKIGKE